MVTLELSSSFGYVVAVGIAGALIHQGYMPAGVIAARKKFKIKYPNLYATPDICPDEKTRNAFNCVQRAHQNSLENFPTFLFLLSSSGFKYPVTASILGGVYLIGRVLYFSGYSTGNPEARYRGGVGYIGLFGLLGTAVKVAYDFLSSA